jgi:hypothetical protein
MLALLQNTVSMEWHQADGVGFWVKRLHHGWVMAGVRWFTMLAAAGSRSMLGVLIVRLKH